MLLSFRLDKSNGSRHGYVADSYEYNASTRKLVLREPGMTVTHRIALAEGDVVYVMNEGGRTVDTIRVASSSPRTAMRTA